MVPPTEPAYPPVLGEVGDRADGVGVGLHSHDEGELSWVSSGTQRVHTESHAWVVPSEWAVWMPTGALHDGSKLGSGTFHWLKLSPKFESVCPRQPCAVRVSPTLEGIIRHIAERETLPDSEAYEVALALASQLTDARLEPVTIPLTRPALLQPIITRLEHEPADDRPLEDWARFLHISLSTLNRAFRRDLGMSFRDFRHQARLLFALEGLARGDDVTRVARSVGYRSPSMFVELFRKKLGVTPGRYFSASR